MSNSQAEVLHKTSPITVSISSCTQTHGSIHIHREGIRIDNICDIVVKLLQVNDACNHHLTTLAFEVVSKTL